MNIIKCSIYSDREDALVEAGTRRDRGIAIFSSQPETRHWILINTDINYCLMIMFGYYHDTMCVTMPSKPQPSVSSRLDRDQYIIKKAKKCV